MDRGAEGERAHQLGLGRQQLAEPLLHDVCLRHLARQPEEEPLVAVLAGGQLSVELLELRVRQPLVQQLQPLGRAALDDASHQEAVELPLVGRVAHELLQPLRVRVAAVDGRLSTCCFGHLADGNVHVNVTGVDETVDAHRVDDAVLGTVVAAGGSVSAEHGIGVAKVGWLVRQRGAGDVAAMRALKAAWDPDGILNPGVLLPGA